MGFRQGAYVRVWNVNDQGKYSTANITVSRKNKETGEYVTEFSNNFVRLVGDAHNQISSLNLPTREDFNPSIHKGVTLRIGGCDVTTRYNPETKTSYTNFTIFSFDPVDDNGSKQNGRSGSHTTHQSNSPRTANSKQRSAQNEPSFDDDDGDLPF